MTATLAEFLSQVWQAPEVQKDISSPNNAAAIEARRTDLGVWSAFADADAWARGRKD
jgi:hypothetical protein